MKPDIHPDYRTCTISCGCGESFVTQATIEKLTVETCSKCHPFYTGKQRFVDTAGRIERFRQKYGMTE